LPQKYRDWGFIVACPASAVPAGSGAPWVSDEFSKKLAKFLKIVI
jgi:hypothetical protein